MLTRFAIEISLSTSDFLTILLGELIFISHQLLKKEMCLPVTPIYALSTNALVDFSAISIDLSIDLEASFISMTRPFLMPFEPEIPKPFIFNILFFSTVPIKVTTLVVPISIPTIFSSFAGNHTSASSSAASSLYFITGLSGLLKSIESIIV